MISCISCENVHEFGTALHSQFRLRYEGFIERQHYDVSVYDGMEFDQYDTPASRYLIYHTEDGKALGVSRLTPTVLSCMLADLWPQLVHACIPAHAHAAVTRKCSVPLDQPSRCCSVSMRVTSWSCVT